MTFQELKKSTIYQTSDFDDMDVFLCVSRGGKAQFEPLCFMGLAPGSDPMMVVLGGLTEIQRMVEAGEISKPDGYIDPSVSDPKLFHDSDEGH